MDSLSIHRDRDLDPRRRPRRETRPIPKQNRKRDFRPSKPRKFAFVTEVAKRLWREEAPRPNARAHPSDTAPLSAGGWVSYSLTGLGMDRLGLNLSRNQIEVRSCSIWLRWPVMSIRVSRSSTEKYSLPPRGQPQLNRKNSSFQRSICVFSAGAFA